MDPSCSRCRNLKIDELFATPMLLGHAATELEARLPEHASTWLFKVTF